MSKRQKETSPTPLCIFYTLQQTPLPTETEGGGFKVQHFLFASPLLTT